MSLAILFHFLCAQHVPDINISIIRSLRLFCWITTSVVLFSVRCVLEIWCGWVGVVSVLQAEAYNTDTTLTQPHQISNTQRTENKTTNVVIQQHSRKLLMMDILMSETCWAHKKWNEIASDIKLVFYSSTITMMHGPINIKKTLKAFSTTALAEQSSEKHWMMWPAVISEIKSWQSRTVAADRLPLKVADCTAQGTSAVLCNRFRFKKMITFWTHE